MGFFDELPPGKITLFTTTVGALRKEREECARLLHVFVALGIDHQDLDISVHQMASRPALKRRCGMSALPLVFCGPMFVGAYATVNEWNEAGDLLEQLQNYGYMGTVSVGEHTAGGAAVKGRDPQKQAAPSLPQLPPPQPPPAPASPPCEEDPQPPLPQADERRESAPSPNPAPVGASEEGVERREDEEEEMEEVGEGREEERREGEGEESEPPEANQEPAIPAEEPPAQTSPTKPQVRADYQFGTFVGTAVKGAPLQAEFVQDIALKGINFPPRSSDLDSVHSERSREDGCPPIQMSGYTFGDLTKNLLDDLARRTQTPRSRVFL